MTFSEACSLLEKGTKLKGRFYDGLFIHVIRPILEKESFVCTYLPCRENANKYEVKFAEFKEIEVE